MPKKRVNWAKGKRTGGGKECHFLFRTQDKGLESAWVQKVTGCSNKDTTLRSKLKCADLIWEEMLKHS